MPQAFRNHLLVTVALLAACSGTDAMAPQAPPANPPPADAPPRLALTPDAAAVFVGDRARLTPVFDGDSGSIEGIGAVQSGVQVETAVLPRTTTFTLRVQRGAGQIEIRTTVRASYRNRIRVLASAPIAQTNHVAAALPGGGAMVMGGNTSETLNVPDSTVSQFFDAQTERFGRGPDLGFSAQTQQFTSVASLMDGGFLLVGTGINAAGGQLRPVITQFFDPGHPGFRRVGDAPAGSISFRTATSLADGGVLLSGGFSPSTNPVSDAVSRYDASSGQWTPVGDLLHVRVAHTATLLRDGRVLVAGGLSCCQEPNPSPEFYESAADIYDPSTDKLTATGSLTVARGSHSAALLPDGRVLIAGGNGNGPSPLGTEIFDPASGQFSPGGDLREARDSHSAVTLTDGRVLVIGGEVPPELSGVVGVGASATELYDPASGRWSAGPNLDPAFFAATVTLLSNGKVLVFGGQDVGGFPQTAAAIFE